MDISNLPQKRSRVLILIAALVSLCLCLSLLVGLGAAWFWLNDESLSSINSPASTPDIDQQMDEIQQQVVQLRGLSPTDQITRTLIGPDQLRLNVTDDFLTDYSQEEARDDALVLSAFGLLEPDFNLFDFYLELYAEQIAGYYDLETKEMFVVQDTGFNGPERLTYAHEYTHVLQDQTYDIQNELRFNDEDCEDNTERCLGIQALIEGDASFLELNWFDRYATSTDQAQIMSYVSEPSSPVYDSAPAFMKEDFVFPYTQGYTFVETLATESGWEAIDRAYAQPPVSSEQILHPELYPDEMPRQVPLPEMPDLLGTDWVELEHGVMGEWYTYLILAYGNDPAGRIEAESARQATAGWGGDVYAVYEHQNDPDLLMFLVSEWDSEKEAQEFEQVFTNYLRGRFGQGTSGGWDSPEGQHTFLRKGLRTVWLLAPDAEMSSRVMNMLTSP